MSMRSNDAWFKVLAEAGRVGAILLVLVGYLWTFGEATVDKYIGQVIDQRRYATVEALTQLDKSVEKLQEQQNDTGKAIATLNANTASIIQNTNSIQTTLNKLLITMGTGRQPQ